MPRQTIRLAAIAGLFFTGDLMFWHHAIEAVGAGLATVLGNLQVIIVGFFAWLLLGERPSRATLLALPVVLLGVILISGVVGEGAYGAAPQLGVILGIATAICYSAYLLIIRWGGRDARRPAGPVAVATVAVVVASFLVGEVGGDLDLTPGPESLFWLAMLGVTAQSAGYLLISISLPRLPAIVTSVILLSQPVMSMGWRWSCSTRRRHRRSSWGSRSSSAASPRPRSRSPGCVMGCNDSERPRPRTDSIDQDPAIRSSSRTVAEMTCACWSGRVMVAGGSFGWPVYQPICSWLPPSMTANVTSVPSFARLAGLV